MKITFLGAGVFGTALANIAKGNSHSVKFYDPYKYSDITIQDATHDSDLNIFTAPSNAAKEILPNLSKETPLICASKGFLSLKPFSDFENFSALGGAGFAEEISAKEPKTKKTTDNPKITTFTTSSESAETIFSTETIHLEYTKDTLGIMLCGALKNIYAIGAGLYGESDSNTAPMSYLESAISEMQTILAANHANPETLRLSCGAADLVLSCTEKSRNFRFGRSLKNDYNISTKNATSMHETVEGLSVIQSLEEYSDFVIPENVNLFKNIINIVKEQYATQ
ncbi:hypothetical protein IKF94_03060 [Candidatus Saccharibacteria bacterium]|nr:hypothetical protein [Candidatus Saccharibacteria bacterium]